MRRFAREFKEFLYEYRILALAVAFIMGVATNDLVKSLVNNIIMPIITPFIPEGAWQTLKLKIGPVILSWGEFVSSLIYFLIISLIVFLIAKKLLKEEKVKKR